MKASGDKCVLGSKRDHGEKYRGGRREVARTKECVSESSFRSQISAIIVGKPVTRTRVCARVTPADSVGEPSNSLT